VKPKAVTQWDELEGASTDEAQTEPLNTTLNTAEEGAQKIIELRVSKTFYEAVKILAEEEGIARADLIRKAVCRYLYAKAQLEKNQPYKV
jgi:predicted DNA binding CopG/RHH family protein